jgi:integrase
VPRPRPTQFEVKQAKPHQGKGWKVTGYVDGVPKISWYSTEREAREACKEFNVQLAAHGSDLVMSTTERADATDAMVLLAPYKTSLTDAARHFVAFMQTQLSSKSMNVFLDQYQAEMRHRVTTGDLKPGAMKALKETMVKLRERFGSTLLTNISTTDLTQWLSHLPLKSVTKERHRSYCVQVFNAAKVRDLVQVNPTERVAPFRSTVDEIHILTPEQVKHLLESACDETRHLYAIAAFAGIRWKEIAELTWEQIKVKEIIVTAKGAKTRSRRVVEITPPLESFLSPLRGSTGSLLPRWTKGPSARRLDRLRDLVEEKAGLQPWKRDWLRHSFCSYLYAQTSDEGYVSHQAGNSPAIIHQRYKALVTKAEAVAYFAIRA